MNNKSLTRKEKDELQRRLDDLRYIRRMAGIHSFDRDDIEEIEQEITWIQNVLFKRDGTESF